MSQEISLFEGAMLVVSAVSGGVTSAFLDWKDQQTAFRKGVVSVLSGIFLHPFGIKPVAATGIEPFWVPFVAAFLTALLGVIIVEFIVKLAHSKAGEYDGKA